MIAALKPYPKMKNSAIAWVPMIPANWESFRIRHVADLLVSNVDKHSRAHEQPVRLCNYVDVYKNRAITGTLDFMNATASAAEIRRFRLQHGDVVLTKDSEDWQDIAVPSFVQFEAEDLVCGYHLAILRPRPLLAGAFLNSAVASHWISAQFHVSATGITRYGISKGGIKSVVIPVPPRDEQEAIVRFLNHANQRIDRFVRSKYKLISLLEEQKQCIIDEAVTRGLDPNTPLKSSGIPWLGRVPTHWNITRAKYLFREVDERSRSGTEEQLSVSHLTGVTPRSQKNVTMFKANSYVGHKVCRPGDLVVNTMWAWMSALGVASQTGIVSPAYGVYRPLKTNLLAPEFADHLFRSEPYRRNYLVNSTGLRASRLRLYPDKFLALFVALPGVHEQTVIAREIDRRNSKANQAIGRAKSEIKIIEEYRTKLISDVVTGQLDVRHAQIPDISSDDSMLDQLIGEVVSEFDEEFEFAEEEA